MAAGRPRMVKLMCRYGGSIMPSPLDGGPPSYAGGVATLVTLQRHTTYARLAAEMRKLYGGAVIIKYLQEGPDKGLDAETTMVEVLNGRDVSNMMMLLESGISSNDDAGSGAGIRTDQFMSIFLYPQPQQQQLLVDDLGNELKSLDDLYTVAALGRRLPRLCPIDVLVPTNTEYEEDGWFMKTLRRNSGSDVEGFWETTAAAATRYAADAYLGHDEQQQLDDWNEWKKRPELLCAAAADRAALLLSSSSSINLGATNREHERMTWFMKKTLSGDSGENLDLEEHFPAADTYLCEVSSTISLLSPSSMDEWVMEIMEDSSIILSHNILDDIILDPSAEPTNLPFSLLQHITKNFSDERQIGSGGFANVYKGKVLTGSVAVKKLLNSQTIEEGTFYREANCLMNVKHPNIVRFLGFCANTENKAIKLQGPGTYAKYIYAEVRERLLCFEYISNGSLDNHLKDELEGLEWHTRYEIIKGICEGLQYLHLEKCILHMDLKPANILLDHLMVPKITDFGISRRLYGISRAVTKELSFSLGYCAPEYLFRGEVSFKTDIYGLGVIIKDIVTGRKEAPSIKKVLRRWRYRWNKLARCPPLGYQQVTKCIELAVRCMAEDSKTRPFIWDIVSVLNETETKDEDITTANEYVDGHIKPYPWELLSLDPLELSFPFEPNKQISCTLKLTNERDDQIGFDIQATNTYYEYKIEPNKGMVPPRSVCNVTITLEAQQKAPQGMNMDRLTVRMAVVEESLMAKDITPDMFDGEMGNMVDELDLAVVFTT